MRIFPVFVVIAIAACGGAGTPATDAAAPPLAVAYNLVGVTLQVSGTSLAKIFSGTVKTWTDAAIIADNPGVTLPNTPITVLHLAGASDDTARFTAYLQSADPTDWTLGTGSTINWFSGALSESSDSAIAQAVADTTGAIGYLQYSFVTADNLQAAQIKNAAGNYTTTLPE